MAEQRESRRVVVTGIGNIVPGATGKDQLWQLLASGRSAIGPVTCFDTGRLPSTIAGETTNFSPSDYMERRSSRRMDRSAQLAVGAARLACRDAFLDTRSANRSLIGVFEGTSLGPLVNILHTHAGFLTSRYHGANPTMLMSGMMGAGSGAIALELGLHGPSLTFADGSVSSACAIGYAYRTIKSGGIDIAIAGGAEAPLAEEVFATFCCARLLSTRNALPQEAMRPFDRDRDGFVLGEGAAFLVLEESTHAFSRHAPVYGEIIGFGETTDAFHQTSPGPEGTWAACAMESALKEGATRPEEVHYLNVHGTATRANDGVETRAIKRVFGDHPHHLSVSSTKPFTGHLLGACGGLEAATTLLAMGHGFVPPTLNLSCPDEGCSLDYVPKIGHQKDIAVAMSNNYSFGGRNSSLLFRQSIDSQPS